MRQNNLDPERFALYRDTIFPKMDFLDSLVEGREEEFERRAAADRATPYELAKSIRYLEASQNGWTKSEAEAAWREAKHYRETIDEVIALLEPKRFSRRRAGRKSDFESDLVCAITRWHFEQRGNRPEIAKAKAAKLLGVSLHTVDKAYKRALGFLVRQELGLTRKFPDHDFRDWAAKMFLGFARDFGPKAEAVFQKLQAEDKARQEQRRTLRHVAPISARLTYPV